MKRVDSDEHDSNLFQDENLPTTAGTLFDETWFNDKQEELCRAVELSGQNLSAGSYYQLLYAFNAFGPADFFHADGAADRGAWVPQATLGTFWVTPGAGLVGALAQGVAWITVSDHPYRVALTAAQIAAQDFDAYEFGSPGVAKDDYIAINATGTLEVNQVADGAGAPTPSLGYRNILKIDTDGTDITACEALHPAFPWLQCYALDMGSIDDTARDTAGFEGFRWKTVISTTNTLEVFAIQGITEMPYAWKVFDDSTLGSTQRWQGDFIWEPGNLTDAKRRWRTHLGTTAEKTRYMDEGSFTFNHSAGAAWAQMKTFPLPHDGAVVTLTCGAVESTDADRVSGHSHKVLLCASTGTETDIVGPDDADTGGPAGILARVYTGGGLIVVEGYGEAGKTWRFTGKVAIVPIDISA